MDPGRARGDFRALSRSAKALSNPGPSGFFTTLLAISVESKLAKSRMLFLGTTSLFRRRPT